MVKRSKHSLQLVHYKLFLTSGKWQFITLNELSCQFCCLFFFVIKNTLGPVKVLIVTLISCLMVEYFKLKNVGETNYPHNRPPLQLNIFIKILQYNFFYIWQFSLVYDFSSGKVFLWKEILKSAS